MGIKVEVSLGELVDKVTILSIKLERITDPGKLKNIQKEYDILSHAMNKAGISKDSEAFRRLRAVNMKLWDIEDRIREKEAQKSFDNEFINLARAVYFTNDERSRIKREINLEYGSDLIEEKSYKEYS